MRPRLRLPEWALIAFFSYSAVISLFFTSALGAKWPNFAMAGAVAALLVLLAICDEHNSGVAFSMARDWVPLGLTLAAYREMNWFSSAHGTHALERQWVLWDRWLLHDRGMQALLEGAGWVGPGFFELCYLLLFAVGPLVVAMLYGYHRRELVDHVVLIYLCGTLLVYAMFPFFPSDPPRTVFAGMDVPRVMTALRRLNLAIVGHYGIHSSVFPSAHVSSVFSAAWGLLVFFREKRWLGWAMLAYGVSVAIATVYGRYHYAVDAVAGVAVSLVALLVAVVVRRRGAARQC